MKELLLTVAVVLLLVVAVCTSALDFGMELTQFRKDALIIMGSLGVIAFLGWLFSRIDG